MKTFLQGIGIAILITLLVGVVTVTIVNAFALNVREGGTGNTGFSPNVLLATGTSTRTNLQATSTPTVGAIHATTTATSTFVGPVEFDSQIQVVGISTTNITITGTCDGCGSLNATTTDPFMVASIIATSTTASSSFAGNIIPLTDSSGELGQANLAWDILYVDNIFVNPSENLLIRNSTVDASDNNDITIAGGGAIAATRGGKIIIRGNESSSGNIDLIPGQSGDVIFKFTTGEATQMVAEQAGFRPQTDSDADLGTNSIFWDEIFGDDLVLHNDGINATGANEVRLSGLDLSAGDSGLHIRTEDDTDHLFASLVGINTINPENTLYVAGSFGVTASTSLYSSLTSTSTVNFTRATTTLATSTSLGVTGHAIFGDASGEGIDIGNTGVRITGDQDGAITFASLGGGNSENLIYNFDDTSNEVSITSGTGVSLFDLNTIGLDTDSLTVGADTVTSLAGDGTLSIVSNNLRVVDLVCTNCIGQTEIVDDYALHAGDVYTGVHDFGGATSKEMVNGTGPTVNATGEYAFDTTGSQFLIYDGAVVQVISATSTLGNNYASSSLDTMGWSKGTATATVEWAFRDAVTIRKIYCQSSHGTSTVQNTLFHVSNLTATSTGAYCNVTGDLEPLASTISVAANSVLNLVWGNATGTVPDDIWWRVDYTIDRL